MRACGSVSDHSDKPGNPSLEDSDVFSEHTVADVIDIRGDAVVMVDRGRQIPRGDNLLDGDTEEDDDETIRASPAHIANTDAVGVFEPTVLAPVPGASDDDNATPTVAIHPDARAGQRPIPAPGRPTVPMGSEAPPGSTDMARQGHSIPNDPL